MISFGWEKGWLSTRRLTRKISCLKETQNQTKRDQNNPVVDEAKADLCLVSARFREDRGISSHHDCSPSNAKSRQEDPRTYLERDNRRGRLKNCVCDEENQSRNRVSVAFIGSKIVMHASDCGVWPNRVLERAWTSLSIGRSLHIASVDERDAVHQSGRALVSVTSA